MSRLNLKGLIGFAVVAATAAIASQAEAGFHHHRGGWGWSGGSYGSCGYGSYGSSGGSSGGSYGSYGSSGGSYGSYGSWGSWGGYGSSGSSGGYAVNYGCSGGSSGGWYGGSSGGSSGGYVVPGTISPGPSTTPAPPAPAPGSVPAPAPADALPGDATPGPAGASTYLRGTTNALLSVNVPADAKVYVNGTPTSSTGVHRQYISRNLQQGARYNYEVRVEATRDGRTVTETKNVQLGAGENSELAFNFNNTDDTQQATAAPRTSVMVHVPADAKVFLSGHEMTATGPVRQFSTSRLGAGDEWAGYTIRATIERDGQLVTKERTISLRGGDAQDVSFDFDNNDLAENTR